VNKIESIARSRISSVMPGFTVGDMNRAVDFYEGRLGFHVTFRNGAVFTIVSRDGIEISLALDHTGAAGKGACYFKLDGIDAIHDEFLAKGVTMTHPLKTETYGMREFMITDPDGNTLNFGELVRGHGQDGG
jgi:catechol 2,3-dioxygenase-like lactoylglutathione lyase family enzyme